MNLMMRDSRLMSSDELRSFLGSSEALTFRGQSRAEAYAWIEKTLRQYKYFSRSREEKGLLRRYLRKMTGYSPAQLTRLLAQFRRTGQVREYPYQRHHFPIKFTREDQLLLAEVDEAHDRLSGPATLAILKREYDISPPGVPTVEHHLRGPFVPLAWLILPGAHSHRLQNQTDDGPLR
jgi:hypothetical protein